MSDAPPNVGLLSASLSSAAGGLFGVMRDVANRLQAQGMPQSVFGLSDASLAHDRAQWAVEHFAAFDGFGPKGFRLSPALTRALLAADLDVLHLHGIWNSTSFAAWRWRRRTGRPLLISPHGMLDPGALAFSSTKKRLAGPAYERANLCGASAIHALNVAEAQAVRAFGVDVPIAIIPNGVDLPSETVVAARDWSGDDRKTMLFLARLHPKKGVQELIAAWRTLIDRAPETGREWRLVLGGWDDGGTLDLARRQIAELNLTAQVELPGPLFGDAKHAALAAAHAFILPSRSEGLPVTVLEAWAYGLPVFMTAACNLPSGFAADAAVRIETDPDALAAGLARDMGDTARLQAMGCNGRALVERDFAWGPVVADYAALYRWLARGGAVPPFVTLPDRKTIRS